MFIIRLAIKNMKIRKRQKDKLRDQIDKVNQPSNKRVKKDDYPLEYL